VTKNLCRIHTAQQAAYQTHQYALKTLNEQGVLLTMKQPKRDRTTKAAKTNKTMYPIPQRLGMAKEVVVGNSKKEVAVGTRREGAGRE
jgi:predicted ATPase